MTWPALYNRFPLLYPDSMSYLEDGPLVARAIFLHKFSADYGGRSFIYCLGILPLHWNVNSWPIVGLNSLLTAYFIWLVMRSILPPQPVKGYNRARLICREASDECMAEEKSGLAKQLTAANTVAAV